jgi:hypothetical protein
MKTKRLAWLFPVLVMTSIFTACDDGGVFDFEEPVPRNVNEISVRPSRAKVKPGLRQQFDAFFKSKNASVTWRISGNTDSETTISASGLLKIGADEKAENITVTANPSSGLDASSGTAIVTVIGNGGTSIERGLTVIPGIITVGKGFQQTFKAVASADGSEASGVVWTLDETSGGSLIDSSSGVLTVGAEETAQKLVIKAELSDGNKYGVALVYIAGNGGILPKFGGPYPENLGIEVAPITVTLDKGTSETFTASGGGGDIEWSLSGASASKINKTKGILSVNQQERAENLIVRAESDSGKYGTAVVTVRGNETEPPVVVDGLYIEPQYVSTEKGGKQPFNAKYDDGEDAEGVTWGVFGSGDTRTMITTAGELTVGPDETAAYITVRGEADGGFYGTAYVEIKSGGPGIWEGTGPVTDKGILVTPEFAAVPLGGNKSFDAFLYDGETIEQRADVYWRVNLPHHAGTKIIDGVLTISQDETEETLTVVAVSTTGDGKYGAALITIGEEKIPHDEGLRVSPGIITVKKGTSGHEFTAFDTDDNKVDDVRWMLDPPAFNSFGSGTSIGLTTGILKIDAAETQTKLTVRAVSKTGDGKHGTALVNISNFIEPNPVADKGIVVTPNTLTLLKGTTQQFAANTSVYWSVDAPHHTDTTITTNGFLTISTDEKALTLTVRAVSNAGDGKYGTALVTIPVDVERRHSVRVSVSGLTSTENDHYNIGAAYGNGVFVIGGANGRIYRSEDSGESWTQVTGTGTSNTSIFGANAVYGMAYGNNVFVASGEASGMAYSEDDGKTWNVATYTQSKRYGRIRFLNGKFYAVGFSGAMASSTDGKTWTDIILPSNNDEICDIEYGNGHYVIACRWQRTLYSSTTGESDTWTVSTNDYGATFRCTRTIIYSGGKFIVGGCATVVTKGNSNITISSTGISDWVIKSNLSGTGVADIAYGGGMLIATGDGSGNKNMGYSRDNGETWTVISGVGYDAVGGGAIAYGNGRFVIVDGGQVWIIGVEAPPPLSPEGAQSMNVAGDTSASLAAPEQYYYHPFTGSEYSSASDDEDAYSGE